MDSDKLYFSFFLNMATIQSNPDARLNVLLAEDRPHAPEHWITQLPRLLAPQGVAAYITRYGHEAIELAQHVDIHAVILDLASPPNYPSNGSSRPRSSRSFIYPSGSWLLQLGRLLPNRPPVIVVRGRAYSRGQVEHLLREALKLGVFSVVNAPVHLEHLLIVLQRIVDQQYRGHWPGRLHRTFPDKTTMETN